LKTGSEQHERKLHSTSHHAASTSSSPPSDTNANYTRPGLDEDPAVSVVGDVDSHPEDALVRLLFIYRVAVVLHDVEGWAVREIAELQEISLDAAKTAAPQRPDALVTALAAGHERRRQLKGVPMRCWDARKHISDYLDGTLISPPPASLKRTLRPARPVHRYKLRLLTPTSSSTGYETPPQRSHPTST
jgi:hypothetical protein